MSSPPSMLIRTPGYWPLPKFASIYAGGKWLKLKPGKLEEKSGEYIASGQFLPSSPPFLILEATITKALPKKVHLHSGSRRLVLSRWIGGLYSNLKSSASQTNVRAFYNAIAPKYKYHVEPGRDKQLGALAKELSALLPPRSRVLDASAGNCTFAKSAKASGLPLEIWCNDISEKMLELGGSACPPSRRSISSASRLPHTSFSFDALVHTYSNIHKSDRRFFRSFARVLKDGGVLLYHPVKAPGEQWPKNFDELTRLALHASGFSHIERRIAHAHGARRQTTLLFFIARK